MDVIRSRRLDLVSLPLEVLDAFAAGDRAAAQALVDFAVPDSPRTAARGTPPRSGRR